MSYCVYKLDSTNGLVYFGMTNNVNKRWYRHMQNAREDGECSSKKLWHDDTSVIEMHELEWFESKEEAHEREIYLIQNNNCVNKMKYNFDAKANKKEYYENNKGVIAEYKKDYYEKNKDELSQKKKEKIACDVCASIVRKSDMSRHMRTAKCKSHLNE